MIGNLDPERIKQSVNLVDLAGYYVVLHKVASGEWAGPCPKCRGEDRFHCQAEWFFCRVCHEKRGDCIDFMMWANEIDFREACERLGNSPSTGHFANLPAITRREPERKPSKSSGWRDPQWQHQAAEYVDIAAQRLAAPGAGEPGRDYLAGRGIQPETAKAWGLGFDPAKFDPGTERKRPAIVMPWHWGKAISAVKHRFIDDLGQQKEHRFTQKGGGEQRLFGLQLRGDGNETLCLVEGELNALSIWQALRVGKIGGMDVISFGSEGRGTSEHAAKLASRYAHVVVWCDGAENAAAAALAAGGAFALQSPRGMDANDLLGAGLLPDFLAGALERFGLRAPVIAPMSVENVESLSEELIDWAEVRRRHAGYAHGGQLVEWRPRADGNGIGCPLCWAPAKEMAA